MVFREVHCMHWQRHCQHAGGIPTSPLAYSLGDWRVSRFVAGGRTCQAVSWVARVNPTHPTSSNIWKRAEVLCQWTLQVTLSWVGCLCYRMDRNSRNMIWKNKKKRMNLPFQSEFQVRWPQGDQLQRKQNCLAFFKPLSCLPLVLPGISCGCMRICLFPVLISHSLPLHFPSFSFSCFYPLPDRMSSRKSELSA